MSKTCLLAGAALGLIGPALAYLHTGLRLPTETSALFVGFLFPAFFVPPHHPEYWKPIINVGMFLAVSLLICSPLMTAWRRHVIGVTAWLGLLGTFLTYRVITWEVMEIIQATAAFAAYLSMTFMLDRCARRS